MGHLEVMVVVMVAQAHLAEAQAALEIANAQRAYTSITSPVDGVVVGRLREAGDLATPGVPILEIEARNTLVFQTYVAESRVTQLDPAQPVRVSLDAAPDVHEGRLLRVAMRSRLACRPRRACCRVCSGGRSSGSVRIIR